MNSNLEKRSGKWLIANKLSLEFMGKVTGNCFRNENVLKLPRHGVYDILKIKSHKKVGVTELVKKI